MTKILYDGDFVEQLEHFPEISFNLTTSRGKPTLEQTKRNIARAELLTSLAAYLSAVLDGTGVNAYRTADGVALEISHDGVYAAEQAAGLGETTNGTVVITLSATMESLEYDAYQAALDYQTDMEAKAKEAAARAARDAAKEARRQAAASKKAATDTPAE